MNRKRQAKAHGRGGRGRSRMYEQYESSDDEEVGLQTPSTAQINSISSSSTASSLSSSSSTATTQPASPLFMTPNIPSMNAMVLESGDAGDEPSALDEYDAEEADESASKSASKSASSALINIETKAELVKERDLFFDSTPTADDVIAFIKRFPPSLKRAGITQVIKAIKSYVGKTYPTAFSEPECDGKGKQHQQKYVHALFFSDLKKYLNTHTQGRVAGLKFAIGAQINLYLSNQFKDADAISPAAKDKDKEYINKIARFAHLVTAEGAINSFLATHLPVDANQKVSNLNDPAGRNGHKIRAYDDLVAFSQSQTFMDHCNEEYERKISPTELTTDIYNCIRDINWADADLDADFIEKMLQAKFMNSYRDIFGEQIGHDQSRMGKSGSNWDLTMHLGYKQN